MNASVSPAMLQDGSVCMCVRACVRVSDYILNECGLYIYIYYMLCARVCVCACVRTGASQIGRGGR